MAKRILKGLYSVGGAADLVHKDVSAISRAMATGHLDYVVSECDKVKLLRRKDVEVWAAKKPGRPWPKKRAKKVEGE